MNPRLIAIGGLMIAFATPLVAQGNMAGMDMDQTNKIAGSGKLPPGWMNRWDSGNHALTEVDVKQAGNALQFRTGPAAIYWNTRNVGSGQYTVTATFSQKKSMAHEAYGLFIGGSGLEGSEQNYLYMVIKPQSGTLIINHRSGAAAPTAIVAGDADPAINKDAPGSGAATNTLAIRVGKDSVYFYINGKTVKTFATTAIDGASTTGIAGIRVNHNLDITVEGFGVKH